MKKPLSLLKNECWHFADGKKISGVHDEITGDVSGIRGDASNLRGDVTGIRGDLDEIPIEDRKDKPNVSDWVGE